MWDLVVQNSVCAGKLRASIYFLALGLVNIVCVSALLYKIDFWTFAKCLCSYLYLYRYVCVYVSIYVYILIPLPYICHI